MPYIALTDVPTYTLHIYNALFIDRLHSEPQTTSEPPLKCYVTASCPRARSTRRRRLTRRPRVPDVAVA
jgi:hypothetical protein